MVTSKDAVLLNKTRNERSIFNEDGLYNFNREPNLGIINGIDSFKFLLENKNRYKREENQSDSVPDMTTRNQAVGQHSSPVPVTSSDIIVPVHNDKNISTANPPITGNVTGAESNTTPTKSKVTNTNIMNGTTLKSTTRAPTTKITKPKASIDDPLKGPPDGKQMSDLTPESGDENPVVPAVAKNTGDDAKNTGDEMAEKSKEPGAENQNYSSTVSSVGKSVSLNQSKITENLNETVTPRGVGSDNENKVEKNGTAMSTTTTASNPVKVKIKR